MVAFLSVLFAELALEATFLAVADLEVAEVFFATAFLVNGELADHKIQERERIWGDRTFRGSTWENEVWQHGFIDKDWDLTCEYKKILVSNDEEHNRAFEKLEDWLFTNFKIYKKANLVRY